MVEMGIEGLELHPSWVDIDVGNAEMRLGDGQDQVLGVVGG